MEIFGHSILTFWLLINLDRSFLSWRRSVSRFKNSALFTSSGRPCVTRGCLHVQISRGAGRGRRISLRKEMEVVGRRKSLSLLRELVLSAKVYSSDSPRASRYRVPMLSWEKQLSVLMQSTLNSLLPFTSHQALYIRSGKLVDAWRRDDLDRLRGPLPTRINASYQIWLKKMIARKYLYQF